MARQSIKREKATANALALFAAEAAKMGIELDTSKIEPMSEAEARDIREFRRNEVDGVLMSLHYPHKMQTKMCRYCGEPFQTNYCSVGYCSLDHRKKDLARYGIKWNPDRVDEQGGVWGRHEPPIVVTPQVLATLETFARTLLADLDRLRSQTPDHLKEGPPISQSEILSPADLEERAVLSAQETLGTANLPTGLTELDDEAQASLPEPPEDQYDLGLDF